MMQRFSFTPELGWSVSRYEIFQTCRRKYWFTYYPKFDQDHPLDRIQALKKMTTHAMEVGSVVHHILETLLKRLMKSDAILDQDKLESFMEKAVEETLLHKEFMEVYYHEVERIDEAAFLLQVKQSVHNVLHSERMQWLRKIPLEERHRWIIEPEGFGETRIDGMKAYCKVDFLIPTGEDIIILDWKTGKVDEYKHRKQMMGYALFAHYHFGGLVNRITPVVAYVKKDYLETVLETNPDEIETFKETVRREKSELESFCSDVKQNKPLEKGRFLKNNPGRPCELCEFRALCW